MRPLLFLLALASTASAATIDVPAQTPLGSPIVATIKDAPAGAKVAWKASKGATAIKVNDSTAHLWGVQGSHTIDAVVASADDLQWLTVDFLIGTPGPAPPTPPSPVATLKDLAGSNASALAKFYTALARQITDITTAANFRAVHKKLLSDSLLAGNGAAAEIDRRLSVVLVDPLNHAKLVDLLAQFVAELGSLPPPDVPVPPTTLATAAVYIYEKSGGPIPSSVMVGIDRLNREKKIIATTFDQDTTDGDGQVPDQYKIPMAAAKESGLPALIVTSGDKVLAVVKKPTTEAQVWEAVR